MSIMSSTQRSARQAGLTMIETVMALLVISIAIGSLIITAQTAWKTTGYNRDQTFGHWVAMNRVAELQLAGLAPSVGEKSSSETMVNADWEVVTITTDTADQLIRRIQIEVFNRQADPDDPVAVSTLFLPTVDPSNISALTGGLNDNAGNNDDAP